MTGMPLPWFFWLFPLALTIHNIEEAIWLPDWSRSASRFHRPVGRFEFAFAVTVITLIAVAITVAFYATGKQSFPAYLFFAFNFGMLVNVFVPHLAATIALRKYCPGLLTGLVLLLPTTSFLLWYGHANEYILFPRFWYVTIPFAALILGSIPVLFRIGKLLERPGRRSPT